MLRRVALLLAATLASTSGAQVRDNVTLEVVQVPVYVTTSDGQPVRGPTKDSFTLLVEGHPSISNQNGSPSTVPRASTPAT